MTLIKSGSSGVMGRVILKTARKAKGMTQQGMADWLHISLRYYKSIESGERLGSIVLWDKMEDLFNIHQRKLRELTDTHHDKEDSR